MTSPVTPEAPRQPGFPVLTAIVAGVTLLISLVAQLSPGLMDLLVRDRPQLLAGQWWRAVSPILVQPDGWGQLAFNLVGIVLVGTAVQRRVGAMSWLSAYLVGGVASVAIYSAWHPTDTGGGSSAAVAALIGVLVLTSRTDAPPQRPVEFAHWYAIFFSVYLTALDLGGVTASVIAGNLSIVAVAVGRRALGADGIVRIGGPVVVVAAVVMTMLRDDHGTGLLIGLAVGVLVLLRRYRPPTVAPSVAVLADLLAPIAMYYLLRHWGSDTGTALLAGAVIPAVSVLVRAVRHRRIDALGSSVLVVLVVSAAAEEFSGDPRILLFKDALLTAAWGCWFLVSVRARRPLSYRLTRPLLDRSVHPSATDVTGSGDPGRWEALWEDEPGFRRAWRVTSLIWAGALFFDAMIRMLMAVMLPIDRVPALSGILWIVTLVALQVVTNIHLTRSGTWTLLRQQRHREGAAAPSDAGS